jgi:hypothetical protein
MQSKYPFIDTLQLSAEAEVKLSLSLDRLAAGSDHVVLTPLGRSQDPKQLLDDWDKIFYSSAKFISDDLLALEVSNRSKYGPRSIAKPWLDLSASVKDGFEPESITSKSGPFSTRRTLRLRPLSLQQSAKFIKKSTNSGLLYLKKKGDVLDDTLNNFDHLIARKDPCVIFIRTQEDGKTRIVWGYPLADILFEMRYYRPLLDYQRRLAWRSALVGPAAIDNAMMDMVRLARDHGYRMLSIDFSTYDQTVKHTLQGYAFDYIKSLYQTQFHNEVDMIADRFNNIGLVTPDGVWEGSHGVPSGSTFTNEVDSIVQYLIARSVIDDDNRMNIQGDDGAYVLTESEVLNLKAKFQEFGLQVNDDKSYDSGVSFVYLQKLFSYEYLERGIVGGIYPVYRALNRLVYQERFTMLGDEMDGKDYFSLRAITILENCKHHPLFEELVRFVLQRDKYGLEYSESGLREYVNKLTESRGSEGLLINQYGDDLAGIENFETVKLIKRL